MIPPQTTFRFTRRAALAFLTPLLLFGGRARGREKPKVTEQSFEITSRASLVHLGSLDSFDITVGGIQAARSLLQALEASDQNAAADAVDMYDRLIPQENYGGEYTALQWFGRYLLASEPQRQQMLADPFDAEFFQFFAEDDFAALKEYLLRKYELRTLEDAGTIAAENRKAFLEDFILFNNPRRESWEKSSKVIAALNIKPGQSIADIGSGPGYYTFQFSKLVGPQGQVFAIDTVSEHLNYIKAVNQKYDINNIELVNNSAETIGLSANQVDLAFMCSLYHVIYVTSVEEVQAQFIESIKSALKPDGTLVIVDNALVQNSELPYHGPYIPPELIIGQLHYYGFRLVDQYAFIPQRYSLVFKLA